MYRRLSDNTIRTFSMPYKHADESLIAKYSVIAQCMKTREKHFLVAGRDLPWMLNRTRDCELDSPTCVCADGNRLASASFVVCKERWLVIRTPIRVPSCLVVMNKSSHCAKLQR